MSDSQQRPAPEPSLDVPGPLHGIRVIEMGQLIAGPLAGQILAGFGADVVKIEVPGRGDPLRLWRLLDDEGSSWWWQSMARNKRSVALDMTQPDAQHTARQLLDKADVVIENFRPGRMESWGLGPEVLAQSNPGLVFTRVSGYGQDGPYAARPGFASVCEAEGGMRYLNGHPGQPPVRANLSLGDTFAALHAVIGTLMALMARRGGADDAGPLAGQGQVVDVSILESVFAMLEGVLPEYDGARVVRQPSGTTLTGIVPTNIYPCADERHVVIGGNGDSIFKRLMACAGRDDLAADARLANNAGRVHHEAEIDQVLASWCSGQVSHDVLEALREAQVPCGPINSIEDIARDPHFQARGAFECIRVRGQERLVPAFHPRLSVTPALTRTPGPAVGEHTARVLQEWLGQEPADR